MKIFEITEAKVEMCPEACCGKPVTECKCGPDCEHCDCHAKNKMNEDEDLGNLIKTGVKGSYDFIAKSIKDFEELIRNNPNHPKVPQVKAELAKLRPQLAQARKDSGMGESDALLDPLKGAYGELFGKQPKEEAPEKIALDQAMEKYKNNPKGLKAWLMKNRNILVWLNTSGSQMMDIVKQRIRETTTAGGIASSMGSGNGFAGGGIGTVSRAGTTQKKRKKKQK